MLDGSLTLSGKLGGGTVKSDGTYITGAVKKKQWVYNRRRYQKMSDAVNTWGDHCVHRIYRLTHNDMDLQNYSDYMDHVRDEYNVGYA